jgi:hypothetical protein
MDTQIYAAKGSAMGSMSSAGYQSRHEAFDDERSGRTAEEEAYRHLLRAIRSGRY